MSQELESAPSLSEASSYASASSRFLGIFTEPGEVFESLKNFAVNHGNWIWPLVLLVILSTANAFVVTAQPQVKVKQHEQAAKQYDELVRQGKMTRQQADNYLGVVEKYMGFFVVGGALVGGTVFGVIMLFAVAAVLWMLAKFAAPVGFAYMKSVELVGLSWIITLPGIALGALLVIIYGDATVSPGPRLLISNFDPHNMWHLFAQYTTVFGVWSSVALGVGFAKLSSMALWKSVAFNVVFSFFVTFLIVLLVLAFTAIGGGVK